jgi:hypothetical protein
MTLVHPHRRHTSHSLQSAPLDACSQKAAAGTCQLDSDKGAVAAPESSAQAAYAQASKPRASNPAAKPEKELTKPQQTLH